MNRNEYKNLMDKRENLWKQYHKVKTEEDKSKILAEINNIQPKIKELRKYNKSVSYTHLRAHET